MSLFLILTDSFTLTKDSVKGFKIVTDGSALSRKPKMAEFRRLPLPNGKTVNIVESMATMYEEFGHHLLNDDSGNEVENIYTNNKGNVQTTTSAILSQWLKGSGKQPVTWETLIKVIETMRQLELARQIREALS